MLHVWHICSALELKRIPYHHIVADVDDFLVIRCEFFFFFFTWKCLSVNCVIFHSQSNLGHSIRAVFKDTDR